MKYKRWIGRSLNYGLAGILMAGLPAVAVAQQSGEQAGESGANVEPSEEQLRLNAEGVSAIRDGEYPKAVELLEEANAIGQMNVTWLNLGRAYQRLGKCEAAKNAYVNVISAPAVEDPPPRLVNAKADQYLSELDDECEEADDGQQLAEAEAKPAQSTPEQSLDKPDDVQSPGRTQISDEGNALGWTLVVGGAVLVGGGVGAHLWAESIRDDVNTTIEAADSGVVTSMNRQDAIEKESRANTLDTVGVSAIAVGALAAGAGVMFLLTSDSVDATPSASVSADGDVSVGLFGRF